MKLKIVNKEHSIAVPSKLTVLKLSKSGVTEEAVSRFIFLKNKSGLFWAINLGNRFIAYRETPLI